MLWSDFQMNWKTFWCLIGIATTLILVPLLFWARSQNTMAAQRYKVEATLTLDGKSYGASRIWAIGCRDWRPKSGGSVPSKFCRFSGEALDIDLKSRGHLFLLLRQSSLSGEASFWAPDQALAHVINDKTGKQALTGKHIPMLVYASDPSDPMTFKHVAPQTLKAALGASSASLLVKVQPSFEKPSPATISKSLPWLKPGVVLRLKKNPAFRDDSLQYIDFERKY